MNIKIEKTVFAALSLAAALWRICKMTKTAMNCIKAAGIGIAAGAAAGAVCKCICTRRRSLKYRARHAANVCEDLLDSMVHMFK